MDRRALRWWMWACLPSAVLGEPHDVDDVDESVGMATSLLQTALKHERGPLHTACNKTVPVANSTKGLPAVGYIACCMPQDMDSANVRPAVARYLAAGGRHVTTAPGYGNEGAVGQGIQDSGVPREEIWVTTALDLVNVPTENIPAWVAVQVDSSLGRLNLSYVDEIYIHSGIKTFNLAHKVKMTQQQGVGMYRGLIDARLAGKVRHIGVGLHTRKEIEHLIESTGVTPDIMSGWIMPFMPAKQIAYAMWAHRRGMAVYAWGVFNWKNLDPPAVLAEHRAIVDALARKYKATPAQIIIRWFLDKGLAMGTSMLKQSYVEEDLHCLQSPLSPEDHEVLESVKWGCHVTDEIQPLSGCLDE